MFVKCLISFNVKLRRLIFVCLLLVVLLSRFVRFGLFNVVFFVVWVLIVRIV